MIVDANPLTSALASSYRRPVAYAGPIVYSEEKPPVIQYPLPPAVSNYKPSTGNDNSYAHRVSYVPLPFEDLPILIYKSKSKPLAQELKRRQLLGNYINRYNNRYGSAWNGLNYPKNVNTYSNVAYGSGGNYFLPTAPKPYYIVKPATNPTVYFPQVRPSNVNQNHNRNHYNSGNSGSNMYYNGATKQQPPHIVYSGHPPIHVYQQPVVSPTMSYGKSLHNGNHHNFHAKMQSNVYQPPVHHKPPVIIYQGARPPVHIYNEKYTNPYSEGYISKYSTKQGSQWEPVAHKPKQIENQKLPLESFSKQDIDKLDTITSDQSIDFVTETKQDRKSSA
ncbi:hypothetical protein CHUAL_005306 [Chamberlinius hualienensis]